MNYYKPYGNIKIEKNNNNNNNNNIFIPSPLHKVVIFSPT